MPQVPPVKTNISRFRREHAAHTAGRRRLAHTSRRAHILSLGCSYTSESASNSSRCLAAPPRRRARRTSAGRSRARAAPRRRTGLRPSRTGRRGRGSSRASRRRRGWRRAPRPRMRCRRRSPRCSSSRSAAPSSSRACAGAGPRRRRARAPPRSRTPPLRRRRCCSTPARRCRGGRRTAVGWHPGAAPRPASRRGRLRHSRHGPARAGSSRGRAPRSGCSRAAACSC
mmetsp:Transcript_45164/g.148128  ORF Transcript_45164/g.148128 Transcript_45164/m.148128 type:complete len:227 (+) Transcript_45164:85-765(+)